MKLNKEQKIAMIIALIGMAAVPATVASSYYFSICPDNNLIGGECTARLTRDFRSLFSSSTSSNAAKEEKEPEAVVYNSSWDASVSQVVDYLNQTLLDPDSLEFIEWSPVVESNDGYQVRTKYRAKNTFGGYVIKEQLFTLDKDGQVLSAIDY